MEMKGSDSSLGQDTCLEETATELPPWAHPGAELVPPGQIGAGLGPFRARRAAIHF